MVKNKELKKFIEGLSILLMIIGVSMVKDFWLPVESFKDIIPLIVFIGGWMLYAFGGRMNK